MQVRVRLFASLRDEAGMDRLELDLAEGATADDAWRGLVARCPGLAGRRQGLSAALNRRYAPFDQVLAQGDEVAFIPPVSGG